MSWIIPVKRTSWCSTTSWSATEFRDGICNYRAHTQSVANSLLTSFHVCKPLLLVSH
jgi:hypothetical protein